MRTVTTFLVAVALVLVLVGCSAVPTRYNLTAAVDPTGGGNAIDLTNDSPYAAGSSVNVKAVANPGYHFLNWEASLGAFGSAAAAATTFTMPAQNVTITANFVRVYDLTTVADPAEGGTAIDLTNASGYAEGSSVSIGAVATGGYWFVNWGAPAGTFGNATAAVTTFTMPAQDVTVSAHFAYFSTDAYLALVGPATLPVEERSPCLILGIETSKAMDGVRVDLPGGGSVIVPAYTDVFSPEVDQATVFRFATCVQGMPVAGGEYIFTGLDAAGEPIAGARSSDVWVGVEPPAPPTNVRAELTDDGILVSWDESPVIPGSFEPAARPQLGWYQLQISNMETGEFVYGAGGIRESPYLVPRDGADVAVGDCGLSLEEMEDGVYSLAAILHSVAPKGSLGRGVEYMCSYPAQAIAFVIQDGEITIG